ncbi:hypothetical protein CPB85DRAFT_1342026 [Mucidula mucida]|nr:hypothetical protein CPB85DRAFT_1342026 [Mucidula mucida]
MIASLAVLSLLTTAAYAQSSTSTANALIPSAASTACKTFLNKLNSDTTLDKCANSMVSASSAYSPGNFTDTPTVSGITKTLNTLCASSCSDTDVRPLLTEFSSACYAELTSEPMPDVVLTYDTLYAIVPFHNALCTKNDGGNYCLVQSASSTASASAGVNNAAYAGSSAVDVSTLEDYLTTTASISRRADVTVTTPNATTWANSNLVYLFLNGSGTASTLCTTCTSNIMSAYMDFEAKIPYGPGIAQSALMSGQASLYTGITSVCGEGFLNSAVQAAGGISSSSTDSSDAPRVVSRLEGVATAMGGLVLASLFM